MSRSTKTILTTAALSCLVACAAPSLAITPNLVTDFQTDFGGWSFSGHGAVIQPDNGPAGPGDAYLEFDTEDANQPRLAVPIDPFAADPLPWQGDYGAAGVTAISVDAINLGATDLYLRLGIGNGTGLKTFFTTTTPTLLTPGSGWTSLTFNLSNDDLTRVAGTGELTDVLSEVFYLRFISAEMLPTSAGSAGPRGDLITGALGLDNVTAVAIPEPVSLAGLAALATPLALRRRRR